MSSKLIQNGFLSAKKTLFMLCDLQERFRPLTAHFENVVKSTSRLVEVSKILDIPLVVTEQHPKALGNTVAEIDKSHAIGTYPKTKFSMCIPPVVEQINKLSNIDSIVLFGIETHACVEQTAVELKTIGFQVHVVADASSSRSMEDRLLAFERMKQIGCFITTTEAVIFKLLVDKEHPKFNAVRHLVKDITPNTGLVNNNSTC